MMGYWLDPSLTDSVLSDKRLVMADIGYLGDDGMLYIMGRRDDVINTGGNKVAPYEIEELAMKLPFVRECVCVGVTDKIKGYVPKLYVVTRDNEEYSQKEIYNFLSTHLETYKLPKYIEEVEAIPKTSDFGKPRRNILMEAHKNER
jgi:long-chain acyl-CoA synthetase